RVLKLVNEDALETSLKIPANGVAVAHEIPCTEQQVEEIECAVSSFQLLVSLNAALKFLPQQCGEIRIGIHCKGVEVVEQPPRRFLHTPPRPTLRERRSISLSRATEITIAT